jgi:hypothetical protein
MEKGDGEADETVPIAGELSCIEDRGEDFLTDVAGLQELAEGQGGLYGEIAETVIEGEGHCAALRE